MAKPAQYPLIPHLDKQDIKKEMLQLEADKKCAVDVKVNEKEAKELEDMLDDLL